MTMTGWDSQCPLRPGPPGQVSLSSPSSLNPNWSAAAKGNAFWARPPPGCPLALRPLQWSLCSDCAGPEVRSPYATPPPPTAGEELRPVCLRLLVPQRSHARRSQERAAQRVPSKVSRTEPTPDPSVPDSRPLQPSGTFLNLGTFWLCPRGSWSLGCTAGKRGGGEGLLRLARWEARSPSLAGTDASMCHSFIYSIRRHPASSCASHCGGAGPGW